MGLVDRCVTKFTRAFITAKTEKVCSCKYIIYIYIMIYGIKVQLPVYTRYTSVGRFPIQSKFMMLKELMSLFSLRVRDPISTCHF